MLPIDHFAPVEAPPSMEYDPYTPVTITWPRYRAILDPLLTRMFGDDGGYLELKCDAASGELVEVVLVSAAKARIAGGPDPLPVVEDGEPVVPHVDLAAAGTEPSPPTQQVVLNIVAHPDVLEIRFPDAPARIVGAGPVRFTVDDAGRLAGLRVDWTTAQRDAFVADFA